MTTSGTTNFTLDIADAIEEAWERAGKRMSGGYDYRTARRSLDLLMIEWCSVGLNMWLVDNGTISMVANQYQYTLPADTIDLIECDYRTNAGTTNQVDLTVNRISVSDYSDIPNKLTLGSRPLQYYINRLQPAPVLYVWPVPDGSQAGAISYWRLRRIQDTGAPASNTMDMPFRFLPALVAGLAYNLAMKKPELMPRVPMLKAAYDQAFEIANGEDRDRAPVRLVPWSSSAVYGN